MHRPPRSNLPTCNRHTPKKQETKEQQHHHHGHHNVAGKMKDGARNFKDTAKGAWDYGTDKAGDIAFGKWGGKSKGGADEYYYGDDEAWAGYGYGSGYGRWPDEDSYGGGGYEWENDKEWQKGSKWEGDYYYY